MSSKTKEPAPEAAKVKTPEVATATNDELLALHAAQGELLAEQSAKIAAQEKQISELTAALKDLRSTALVVAPRTTPGPQPEVTIGNKKYRVLHGVTIRNEQALKTLTATEVAADQALLKQLLESKSSALEAL